MRECKNGEREGGMGVARVGDERIWGYGGWKEEDYGGCKNGGRVGGLSVYGGVARIGEKEGGHDAGMGRMRDGCKNGGM